MRNRDAFREYMTGSLWVLPGISAVLALVAGFILSRVPLDPESPFAFRGTEDDARTLLSNVTSTVVTVIALVLGLTVVALQLSSTQFSPRLLRSFLRDRPTQVVLSTFVATFTYSAAGLYTVGLSAGGRTEEFPRLAVSGAFVLLFASLAMVVYFADHLAHSIQIDAIGKLVELDTLAVVNGRLGNVEDVEFTPPEWAVPLLAPVSGYVQSAYPEQLLPLASQHRVHVRLGVWVGDHVVSGTVLAWMWTSARDEPAPDPVIFQRAMMGAVQVGFERTAQQDAALGIRQLVDMACKALSPAVNDPYTAVQAIDHLSVIFCALAVRPLGDDVAADPAGRGVVIVPGRRFGDYLATMYGLLRRYGCGEPTVSLALLGLLQKCAAVLADDPVRWAAVGEQADLLLADATEILRNPPTSRPSSERRPSCSGVWHSIPASAPGSPSDSAMLNLTEPAARPRRVRKSTVTRPGGWTHAVARLRLRKVTSRPVGVQPHRVQPSGSTATPEDAGDPSVTPLAGDLPTGRHRLPARVTTYWRWRALCSSLPFLVLLTCLAIYLPWGPWWLRWGIVGLFVVVVAACMIVLPGIRYRVFWYAISETEIDLQKGIIFTTRSVVPMRRVQSLRTERGPIADHFRMANLKIRTAAGSVSFSGLDRDEADALCAWISQLTDLADDV